MPAFATRMFGGLPNRVVAAAKAEAREDSEVRSACTGWRRVRDSGVVVSGDVWIGRMSSAVTLQPWSVEGHG